MGTDTWILCAAVLLCMLTTIISAERARRMTEKMARRLEKAETAASAEQKANAAVHRDLYGRVEGAEKKAQERWNAQRSRIESLKKKLDELPLDQLQSIYDSERQFQEGLAGIMSYGVPDIGVKKERSAND